MMIVVNVPLLRRVLDHIANHPDEHDQSVWGTRSACGTSFCVAGHALNMSAWYRLVWGSDGLDDSLDLVGVLPVWVKVAPDADPYELTEHPELRPVQDVAQDVLDLGRADARRLFRGSNELEDLRNIVNELVEREENAP